MILGRYCVDGDCTFISQPARPEKLIRNGINNDTALPMAQAYS